MAGGIPILVHNTNAACPIFDKEAEHAQLPDNRTVARGIDNNGEPLVTVSGIRQADSKLIGIVNAMLRSLGILKGQAGSGFADHAEQKIAAMMLADDSISSAEIVINHPGGPCGAPFLSCQDGLMNALLGDKQLTVNWLDGNGEWDQVTWGGNR